MPPVNGTSCGFCCLLNSGTVHGFDVTTLVFSVILVISAVALLVLLHRRYIFAVESGFSFFRAPIMALNVGSEASVMTWILPTWYGVATAAVIWIISEAVFYLPGADNSDDPGRGILDILRFSVFALSAFFDNLIMFFLWMPKVTRKHLLWSAFLAAYFAIGLLMYVIFIPKVLPGPCMWCGLHFPKTEIWIPYLLHTVFYLLSAILSKTKLSFRPRPQAFQWGLFLLWPYALVTLGLVLFQFAGGPEIGYCLLFFGIAEYTVLYAPVLYYVVVKDSGYCLRGGLVPALIGSSTDDDDATQLAELIEGNEDLLDDIVRLDIAAAVDIHIEKRIGAGAYGEVFAARYHGTRVAVKKLLLFGDVGEADNAALRELVKEASVLVRIRHPNVVLLLAVCLEAGNQSLVMELIDGGSLYDAIHKRKAFRGGPHIPVKQLLYCALQASRGMAFLHAISPPVLHRDLKSGNILVDESLSVVKLCDFGLARLKEQTMKMTTTGTPNYMAPEVLRDEAYSLPSDVWGFGVVLWECECRAVPYDGHQPLQLAVQIAWRDLRLEIPTERLSTDLMNECLRESPQERPTFAQISHELEVLLDESPQTLTGSAPSSDVIDFEY